MYINIIYVRKIAPLEKVVVQNFLVSGAKFSLLYKGVKVACTTAPLAPLKKYYT
jgi:hypothetical protein